MRCRIDNEKKNKISKKKKMKVVWKEGDRIKDDIDGENEKIEEYRKRVLKEWRYKNGVIDRNNKEERISSKKKKKLRRKE